MSAINRLRELMLSEQLGYPVRIPDRAPVKEEPPMDVATILRNDVAAAFRQRAEQAERQAQSDPRPFAAAVARANAGVFRACANTAANGRMPLITGTRLIPGLPSGFDAVQKQACQAGLTEFVSSDHPEG